MTRKMRMLILLTIILTVTLCVFLEKDREIVYESALGVRGMEESISASFSEEDKNAPDFTLKNLRGKDVSLSDYKDKIVFINFWVSWQDLSEEELPELERLSRENDDLVVLAINVREDKEVVEAYIENNQINLNSINVLLDDTGEIGIDYLVGEMPITYFIDSKGNLVDYADEMLTYEEMNLILKSIRDRG